MSEQYHHPDVFDDARAAQYLMLPGPRSMDTIQKHYGVLPLDLPGPRKWHREDLDEVLRKSRGQVARRKGRGREHQLQIRKGVA